MKKFYSVDKLFPIALTLTAFAIAGVAPAFAQSAGSWSAGISSRNSRPYVSTPSTKDTGLGAYAQAPATINHPISRYNASGGWLFDSRGNIGR